MRNDVGSIAGTGCNINDSLITVVAMSIDKCLRAIKGKIHRIQSKSSFKPSLKSDSNPHSIFYCDLPVFLFGGHLWQIFILFLFDFSLDETASERQGNLPVKSWAPVLVSSTRIRERIPMAVQTGSTSYGKYYIVLLILWLWYGLRERRLLYSALVHLSVGAVTQELEQWMASRPF